MKVNCGFWNICWGERNDDIVRSLLRKIWLEPEVWIVNVMFSGVCIIVVSSAWSKPKQSSKQRSSTTVPGKPPRVREEGDCNCASQLEWRRLVVVAWCWILVQKWVKQHVCPFSACHYLKIISSCDAFGVHMLLPRRFLCICLVVLYVTVWCIVLTLYRMVMPIGTPFLKEKN